MNVLGVDPSITATGLALPDGAVATLPWACPAGKGALLSFAELLRNAAKEYLDIEQSELEVGLQPTRSGATVNEVSPSIEKVGGETMAKGVRGGAGIESALLDVFFMIVSYYTH